LLLNPQKKYLYLITSGRTNHQTTPETADFTSILHLVRNAVASGIDFVQLREKQLSAKMLFALTEAAVRITRDSRTRLLVNDRADIAAGAGADGVHLAVNSVSPPVVRETFGQDFLIGVSTHSLNEALAASNSGADFAVFGPIFSTTSKQQYGPPLGLDRLNQVTTRLSPFPVLALGGVTPDNAIECIKAGAQGVAGIGIFDDPAKLELVVTRLREDFDEFGSGH
jgi:thiamine-phosphate diphosphorylase